MIDVRSKFSIFVFASLFGIALGFSSLSHARCSDELKNFGESYLGVMSKTPGEEYSRAVLLKRLQAFREATPLRFGLFPKAAAKTRAQALQYRNELSTWLQTAGFQSEKDEELFSVYEYITYDQGMSSAARTELRYGLFLNITTGEQASKLSTLLEKDWERNYDAAIFYYFYPEGVATPIESRVFDVDPKQEKQIANKLRELILVDHPVKAVLLIPGVFGDDIKTEQETLVKALAAEGIKSQILVESVPRKLARYKEGVVIQIPNWEAATHFLKILAADSSKEDRLIERVVIP